MLGIALAALIAATSPDDPCPVSDNTEEADSCLGAAVIAADAELERLVARLRPLMAADPARRRDFEASQTSWLAYRKATCGDLVDSFWTSGAFRIAAGLQCQQRLTRSRIRDLQVIFSGPLDE